MGAEANEVKGDSRGNTQRVHAGRHYFPGDGADLLLCPQFACGWTLSGGQREPKRGLTHWEPSELELIALEADPKDLDQEGVGEVFEVYIWQDGSFRKDDDDRYPGELRVRLLVGVEPHVRRARFRYYRCGLTEVEFVTPHLPDKAADSGHTPGAQGL
ncbi:MAG: hypothetical protein PVH68_07955 [Armatimonadota bacterium]